MKKVLLLLLIFVILFGLVGFVKNNETRPPVEKARVGVMVGSTNEQYAADHYKNAQIEHFNNYVDSMAALTDDKIDYSMMDYTSGLNFTRHNSQLKIIPGYLTNEKLCLAINKNNPELTKQFSEEVDKYLANGTMDKIISHWIRPNGGDYTYVKIPVRKNAPVLHMAIDATREPLCFLSNNKYTGMDVELAERIAYDLGYKIEISNMQFAGIVAAMQSGKADISCGMYNTPARAQRVNFTSPYFTDGQVLVVKKDANESSANNKTITGLSSLNTKAATIGLPIGYAAVKQVKEYLPNVKVKYFNSDADGITAVDTDKIDGYVYVRSRLDYMAAADSNLAVLKDSMGNLDICAAVALGNSTLANQLNEFIAQYQKDGTAKEMNSRWVLQRDTTMPQIVPPKHPTKTLKIITSGVIEPMTFYKGSELCGYDIEFAKRFAQKYNYTIKFVVLDYSAMPAALQSGQGDCIIADLFYNKEWTKQMQFTDPYIQTQITAAVKKSRLGGTSPAKSTSSDLNLGVWTGIKTSFKNNFIIEERWKMVLSGLVVTIIISSFSLIFGTLLGSFICLMRRSKNRILSIVAKLYIRVIQGTPIVVMLMLLYYVIFGHVNIDAIFVSIIGFSMNFSAYTSEMFRTGIDAVDKGQLEAAVAGGFSKWQIFRLITLPQAAKHILPVYKGEFISMVKMTSIVGYIAVQDLTKASDIIRSRTFDAFFPLIATAILYFIITYIFILVLNIIELKIDQKRRKRVVRGV